MNGTVALHIQVEVADWQPSLIGEAPEEEEDHSLFYFSYLFYIGNIDI